MPRFFLSSLFSFALASSTSALEWKTESLHTRTTPFQSAIDVVFEFRNAAAHAVTIRNVRTNCDCLDATTDQKIYSPGANGRLSARFTVGDRLGLYERTIMVETDEAAGQNVTLKLNIEVPEIVALSQRVLDWKIGSPSRDKTVLIKPRPGLEIDFHSAQATNEDFLVHLKTIKQDEIYLLTIKPKSTKRAANAAIRISGRDNAGHDVLVSAYANVK